MERSNVVDVRIQNEVLRAEEDRCAAIEGGDWAAVAGCLEDDFTFTHANGNSEDKATWLSHASEKKQQFQLQDVLVRPLGEVAVLSGKCLVTIHEARGEARQLDLDIVQVWTKRSGDWRLLIHHGVKRST